MKKKLELKIFPRLLKLSKKRSFFLLGARGTGKSTLLKNTFSENETLLFNLLLPEIAERFQRKPETLYEMGKALPDSIHHIIIDEIQKVPKLLDSRSLKSKVLERKFAYCSREKKS